jgi:hypothetical protein
VNVYRSKNNDGILKWKWGHCTLSQEGDQRRRVFWILKNHNSGTLSQIVVCVSYFSVAAWVQKMMCPERVDERELAVVKVEDTSQSSQIMVRKCGT